MNIRVVPSSATTRTQLARAASSALSLGGFAPRLSWTGPVNTETGMASSGPVNTEYDNVGRIRPGVPNNHATQAAHQIARPTTTAPGRRRNVLVVTPPQPPLSQPPPSPPSKTAVRTAAPSPLPTRSCASARGAARRSTAVRPASVRTGGHATRPNAGTWRRGRRR